MFMVGYPTRVVGQRSVECGIYVEVLGINLVRRWTWKVFGNWSSVSRVTNLGISVVRHWIWGVFPSLLFVSHVEILGISVFRRWIWGAFWAIQTSIRNLGHQRGSLWDLRRFLG